MGNVGGALLNAPQSLGMSTLLAYQRAQEESADRAGCSFPDHDRINRPRACTTRSNVSPTSRCSSAYDSNPYLQNHPAPEERMAALENLAKSSPYWNKKDPPELQFRHDMMRAKLYGFTERPDLVLRRYPATDTSLPARYARAISTYRFGDLRSAHCADR